MNHPQRRKKNASERRAQRMRSDARCISRILKAGDDLQRHRGSKPTRLMAALAAALFDNSSHFIFATGKSNVMDDDDGRRNSFFESDSLELNDDEQSRRGAGNAIVGHTELGGACDEAALSPYGHQLDEGSADHGHIAARALHMHDIENRVLATMDVPTATESALHLDYLHSQMSSLVHAIQASEADLEATVAEQTQAMKKIEALRGLVETRPTAQLRDSLDQTMVQTQILVGRIEGLVSYIRKLQSQLDQIQMCLTEVRMSVFPANIEDATIEALSDKSIENG